LDRIELPSYGIADTETTPQLFGGFRLEPDGSLFRGKSAIHLTPRELTALRLLLAKPGQVVSIPELKEALWGATNVTAESLPRCISSLRARLEPEDCIQTIYKRGYRLTAEVKKAGRVLHAEPRLAIPPFSTDYGVPAHLGPAIAEETIARLSNTQTAGVQVLARDSCFALAKRGLTAIELGRTLQADLVLSGTMRTLPCYFRLRVEMLRVADGVQIWVEDMLVERERSVAIEGELVERLTFRLAVPKLEERQHVAEERRKALALHASAEQGTWIEDGASEKDRTASGGFSIAASASGSSSRGAYNHEAYEFFLHGRHEWQTMERHRMQDGLQKLTRASELDPTLIAAKVELANLCVTQAFYGYMAPATSANLINGTADTIPDLPQTAPAMLPAMGWINFHFNRNLAGALWAFSASEGLPHDPWTTRVRAMFALSRRQFAEAISLLRAALEIDPYSPWLSSRLALAYHLDGQADASVEQIGQAISLFPGHEGSNLYGAIILAYSGETAKAVELAADLAHRLPYLDMATSVHSYALACAGREVEARALLERLDWLSRERFVMRTMNVPALLVLEDPEAAVAELRRAADTRCPWFFQTLGDPRLKPLHGHPEFVRLESILPRMEAAAAEMLEKNVQEA
jgi:DNA-binding winged helix-turn-helix (wHTH) protein/tetratricopeptide (TPR) repeat protein